MFNDGTVQSWGKNRYGQLGHSDDLNIQCIPQQIHFVTPIQQISVNETTSMALDIYGKIYTWGYYAKWMYTEETDTTSGVFCTTTTPCLFEPLQSKVVVQIACGNCFFTAVTEDKYNAFIWGSSCCYNMREMNHQSLTLTRIRGLKYVFEI